MFREYPQQAIHHWQSERLVPLSLSLLSLSAFPSSFPPYLLEIQAVVRKNSDSAVVFPEVPRGEKSMSSTVQRGIYPRSCGIVLVGL